MNKTWQQLTHEANMRFIYLGKLGITLYIFTSYIYLCNSNVSETDLLCIRTYLSFNV